MSWKDSLKGDNLHRASFRKVPFFIRDSETEIGRRNVLHQYPFQDTPYLEDLGSDADVFTINGYVIQRSDNAFDYFAERDNLINALKQKGSGTLIHPFLGEMTVGIQGKAKVSESFDTGGMARFTITFIQAGKNKYPSITIDHITTVDNMAEDIQYVVLDHFTNNRIVPALPDKKNPSYFHLTKIKEIEDITSFCNMITRTLSSVKGRIQSTVDEVTTYVDSVLSAITTGIASSCSLASTILDLINKTLVMIGIPNPVINAVIGTCSGMFSRDPINLPGDSIPMFPLGFSMVKGLVELSRFGESSTVSNPSQYGGQLEEITVTNINTAIQKANRMQLVHLIRTHGITVATRIAIRIEYSSYDDALNVMNLITEAIDTELMNIGEDSSDISYSSYGINFNTDDLFISLENIRATFIKSIMEIGTNLATLVDYTVPPAVLSTLVLAYTEYNDINREEEIINRNYYVIDHPGFLPEGEVIKILNE